jgi:ribosomal protein S18 acetylase RimI-like enzyme
MTEYNIRRAGRDDIPALRAMQARSLRRLGAAYYDAGAVEAFLRQADTLEAAVVDEGHAFLAEDRGGAVLGSGAWSLGVPGYAAAAGHHARASGTATIRSVFVDPAAARRGIGSALMRHAETDAARHGVLRTELLATLSGVPLYRRLGYRTVRTLELRLPDGTPFPGIEMTKPLDTAPAQAA